MERQLNLNQMPTYISSLYCNSNEENHSVKLHSADDVIVFVFRGRLRSGSTSIPAGRYSIVRSPQNEIFSGEKPEYFFIYFRGSYDYPGYSIPVSDVFDYRKVISYFNRLWELEYCPTSPMIEKIAYFYLLMAYLLSERIKSRDDVLAQAIMGEILKKGATDISLKELSEKYFYSQNYIISVFKKKFQVTPYRHIARLRIERAKILLVSTTKTCNQIASECGYHDFSTFYKAFHAETGESPSRWRKKAGKAETSDYLSRSHAMSDNESNEI